VLYFQSKDDIVRRAKQRDIRIGFIGLGRVGLPLAATLAEEGFLVTGVDINKDIVTAISDGRCPILDEQGLPEAISGVTAAGRLRATGNLSDVGDCDVYIIAVPTLIRGKEPNIDAVDKVALDLAAYVRSGQVVVLQSTVPPGTTERVLGEFVRGGTRLRAGMDYGLAYSPERTQAPQVLRDLRTYPKVIGGIDDKSALILAQIYGSFAPSILRMSNIAAAELDKVVENTYRDVNIAFANELAQICDIYGVDAEEVIAAANSQPYSHILDPGLVGGHCIPMDPYYIISDLTNKGYRPKLIKTSRDLNESIFKNIVNEVGEEYKQVTVLGLSFKKDVKSFDTSHSLKLISLLQEKGKRVIVHDPFITDEHFTFEVNADVYEACRGSDCIIVSTAHSEYEQLDLGKLKSVMRGRLIIDLRSLFSPSEVASLGMDYRGIGSMR
jgi:nucleotide sugar dehydrogenase